MARLTRTQKYAELRERMAHDSEASFSTPDLGKYEEKLTELDDLFKKVNGKQEETQAPSIDFDALGLLGNIELKKETVEEVKEEVQEDSIEKISQDKMEKVLSIEQMVENMVSEVEKEIRKIAPVEATPTYTLPDATPVEDLAEAVVEETNEVEKEIDNLFEETAEEVLKTEENVAVEETQKEVEVKEEPQEEVVINVPTFSNEFEALSSRTDTIISLMDDSMKPEPIKEEVQVEEIEVQEETVKEEVEVLEEVEEPAKEAELEEEIVEDPTLEIASEDLKDIDELLDENFKDIDNLLNDELVQIQDNLDVQEEVSEVEEVVEEVQEPTVIEEPEIVEEEKNEIDNSFITEALEEVNEYNLDKGNQTMDTLSSELIDKVRHNDFEIPAEEDEDEDVSNTISLELDKVLSSMDETLTEEVLEPEVKEEETKVVDIAEIEEDEEEHKAIAQTLEEDVVEIKSLDETLKIKSSQVVTNVLDDTMPFDISGDEEYEDDVPSKTLNIILGVLIAVLVLVLCVIIYYILVARGILG